MKEFDELVQVTDDLLGPQGCPWDRAQTMKTIRTDVLEEVSELIESIDLEDNDHICEELGDVFFNVVFLSRLAEKENRTTMKDALKEITAKLIRRHPHVYGEEKIRDVEELYATWNKIKLTEKGKESRVSIIDGIPKGLPALARAFKVIKKIKKTAFPLSVPEKSYEFSNEQELGALLISITKVAVNQGLNPELALRQVLSKLEQEFLAFEKASSNKPLP